MIETRVFVFYFQNPMLNIEEFLLILLNEGFLKFL